MADIQISTQTLTKTVTNPTYTALNATDIYYVPNNSGRTILFFKNTNGSSATITFDVTQEAEGALTIADHTISVPATTGERFVGNLPRLMEQLGAQVNKLKFTCSVATGASVAALTI